MRTITCFDDRTRGTFLIIVSVSRTKITGSHRPITLWMRMFSTVLHLLMFSLTGKSKLCKKRKINIWNYRSLNYLQCRPSWLTAYAQSYQVTLIYGAKIPFPWRTVIIGRKSHLKHTFSVELLYHKHSNIFRPLNKTLFVGISIWMGD